MSSKIERDLGALAGEPRTIKIAGGEYKVRPYTPRVIGKLTAWMKDNGTHPVAAVKPLLIDVPPDVRDALLSAAFREARESWPPQVGSPAAGALLSQGEGLCVFLETVLAPCNPGLSRADVERLAAEINMAEYGRVVMALAGMDPEMADVSDPNGVASSA